MKILQVNKFHYLRGGAEKYFLDMSETLRQDGHEVAVFSMRHPKNLPSPWEKYFVSRISFNESKLRDKLLAPGRIIYSLEAKRKFEKLVNDFHPDIIHIHNIYHQLSPSILSVARKHNIPVVMHLHDYKLVCPNYQLFVDGQICYRCRKHRYCQAVKHRCFNGSLVKSILVAIEMFLHHRVWKIYEKNISLYIAPSEFMKKTVVSFGIPEEKVEVLYNFIDQPEVAVVDSQDYLLYYGRISPEKGINILLQALKLTPNNPTLKIVGSGPSVDSLKASVKSLGLEKTVEFLGARYGAELNEIILKAKAVIIPSVWAENMPFVLLESLALGKVVIASKTGGLPELIVPGESGFLFENGSASDLAEKIKALDNYNLKNIGLAAKNTVADLTLDKHYLKLLAIYQRFIKK
ncbi:MAG: glycosyltransferase [Candidatus Falkowbacteria bacterium]